jgi:hypothetical protein
MKRRITEFLAGVTMMAAMIVAAGPSAHAFDPWQPGYAQEALGRDYAWLGYYQKHHNWTMVQVEEAKIAQQKHRLREMRHFERNHDYSYHHDYPPGWAH